MLNLGRVPAAARWLGLLGLLPFLAGVIAALDPGPDWIFDEFGFIAYGAVILSFMGGIHWGLAMAQDEIDWERLGLSVLPALIGWVALLLAGTPGLLLLAAAFVLIWAYDVRQVRRGKAPEWYPDLRLTLTVIVVVSSLLMVAFK